MCDIKVELLKHPTEADWAFCKTCTLNTVGKQSTVLPKEEWMIALVESEHSPLRELIYAFRLTIPYYVSVHLCRHHVSVNHYVQSQRNDRQDNYDRTKAPQDAMVSHIISMNMQSFVHLSHNRLCMQADKTTRKVVEEMVRLANETNPEMKSVLVPKCIKEGGCCEFSPCGLWEGFIENNKEKNLLNKKERCNIYAK